MVYPRVSILWINYHSFRIMDLVLESLRGIRDLDYPNYELIVVDNGSTDGSYEVIRDYVNKYFGSRAKIIRLNKNLGFCGGNNVAFRARDPSSKYVVILNNDAIPYPDSLKNLVEEMEKDDRLGSAQGIIVDYDLGYIDTAGGFMDELLLAHQFLHSFPPTIARKSTYVTYADGAYSIYRVEAIRRVNMGEKLFYNELFAYYEDSILGLKMWNYGYMVKTFPFVVARHRRSSTFKVFKPLKLYLYFRNYIVLKEASNSRYKSIINLYMLRKVITDIINTKGYRKDISYILIKALSDAKKLSRKLMQQGLHINLYKAPIIGLDLIDVLKGIILRRVIVKTINKNLLRPHIVKINYSELNMYKEFHETEYSKENIGDGLIHTE